MHNYSSANSARQKMYNWATLNQKVFRRLGFLMEKSEIDATVNCKPGAVEVLLMRVQRHIADIRAGKRPDISTSGSPVGGDYGAGFGGALMAPPSASAQDGGAAMASQQAYTAAVNAVGSGGAGSGADGAVMAEKDATIRELSETIDILELKVKKLEQVRGSVCVSPLFSARPSPLSCS
jgi:hypothetical protein